jgi:hypothetical protein
MRARVVSAASAALLLATGLAMTIAAPAYATTFSITDSYTFSESYSTSHGGPSITNDLGSSISVTEGTPTSFTNLATFAPQGTCSGGGCSGGTETDPFTVTFGTFNFGGGVTAAGFSESGKFEAKYGGTEIGCAAGDSGSGGGGDTDCVLWGTTTAFNGSVSFSELMTNGLTLTVTFDNASDWNISPQVSFSVTDAPAAPELSTWGMMLAGFGLLGFAAMRKSKREARLAA